ncbi:DnaJ-domain-containing protein [Cristinia sonorae]|uniref:DnaJ-domain-containing protein n=1 Tax=Cristinia sonorae TaxID=1940300 RepID=A0A8K0XU98_9AGAR|nr:DnaJ-domain-containing protein [Cristinia sonorae]
MDDRPDPITQFFPDVEPEDVNLYAVLSLTSGATPDEIKKAYRKLALIHHPDKHATASESARADASLKFQQVGFAFSVLSDEKKRERYDKTGRTDEGAEFGPDGEGGWEAYFEDLFDQVTRDKLDELKKDYQGSAEEVEDLKKAYVEEEGFIDGIMQHIPHSTFDDEARFIIVISDLIKRGDLPKLKTWEKSIKDEKAKLVRKKQAEKEAGEAEELARELGVWDEFYGSGKAGPRKAKSKGKAKAQEPEEEDVSALQALILKRKQGREDILDGIMAKYADADKPGKGKAKGKKRTKGGDEDEDGEELAPPPKKRSKKEPGMPDISEEEFKALQDKMFKPTSPQNKKSTRSKAGKGSRR